MKRRINTLNIIRTDVYLFNKKIYSLSSNNGLKTNGKIVFHLKWSLLIGTKKKVRRKRNTYYIKTKATSYKQKMNSDYVKYNLIFTDIKLNNCTYLLAYIIPVYLLVYSYDRSCDTNTVSNAGFLVMCWHYLLEYGSL